MGDAIKQFLTDPPVQAMVFWLCAAEAIVAALVAAFSRSIVRAAYSLFFALFALAGFYVLLSADFMAIVQVVVYIGGILALILFGVLLTNRSRADLTMDSPLTTIGATVAAATLFVALAAALWGAPWGQPTDALTATEPTTRALGHLLLSKHLLPFEFISLTLLVALLGASALVRREDD